MIRSPKDYKKRNPVWESKIEIFDHRLLPKMKFISTFLRNTALEKPRASGERKKL